MKKAIVLGANGFIGKRVVSELLSNNIDVLAITRQKSNIYINDFNGVANFSHLCLDSKQIFLLPQEIENLNWSIGKECVFYNFSWEGGNRLMDGSIEEQLSNVILLSNSIKVASNIGCSKYIDSGSIEETFAEIYLNKNWGRRSFSSSNGNYSVSKLATRDMSNLLGYLNKIDYVHTRFSACLDKHLSNEGFISQTFKKILIGDTNFETPLNQNLFDIIDIDDLSKAYYLLGLHGKNKVDYFIGSGIPQKLEDYFEIFVKILKGEEVKFKEYSDSEYFNSDLLLRDTGLDLKKSLLNLLTKIHS
jgi:UDP-glucose 4-epimerase